MSAEKATRLSEEDHKALALWAADCAEHVLSFFVEKHPEDDRPRKAIEAARAWVRREIRVGAARRAASAAQAAARAAEDGAPRAAARAAGHAAATTHVADHARAAGVYAAKAAGAAAAAVAGCTPGTGSAAVGAGAADAVSAAATEREWQHQRLPERLWLTARTL
jgi:hypothetical protein